MADFENYFRVRTKIDALAKKYFRLCVISDSNQVLSLRALSTLLTLTDNFLMRLLFG